MSEEREVGHCTECPFFDISLGRTYCTADPVKDQEIDEELDVWSTSPTWCRLEQGPIVLRRKAPISP